MSDIADQSQLTQAWCTRKIVLVQKLILSEPHISGVQMLSRDHWLKLTVIT